MKKIIMVLLVINVSVVFNGSFTHGFTEPSDNYRIVSHSMEIEILPELNMLKAVDSMLIENNGVSYLEFFLHRDLGINSLTINQEISKYEVMDTLDQSKFFNDQATVELYSNAKLIRAYIPEILMNKPKLILEIGYSGMLYDKLKVPDYSREGDADQTKGIISPEGAFLYQRTHWYPDIPDSLAKFTIKVTIPREYEVVSEGYLSSHEYKGKNLESTWKVRFPLETCTLVAGKYVVTKRDYNGIKLSTYFFEEDQGLAKGYLDACERFMEMYQKMLGKYPFKKFAVVENFFSTGYGMPSYTLLGQKVLRLPFIKHTSLGHEILHNWFGNGIYVDSETGNWCEGLTVYCADYHYKELKGPGEARDYRLQINQDYSSYVHDDNDFPLTRFRERTTPASRTIGYGKSAMVFHMLQQLVGDDIFFKGLRTITKERLFKPTSWTDFENVYSDLYKHDLGWFFTQWIEKKGAPSLEINNVSVEQENGFRIKLEITQNTGPYKLHLPVTITTEKSVSTHTAMIDKSIQTITFTENYKPLSLKIDPDHHVFRKIVTSDIPTSINKVLGSVNQLVVYPAQNKNTPFLANYKKLSEDLARPESITAVPDYQVNNKILESNNLIILGSPRQNVVSDMLRPGIPVDLKFLGNGFSFRGEKFTGKTDGIVVTFKNPLNSDHEVLLFMVNSPGSIIPVGRKIVHYGKYGYVVFKDGKRYLRGKWEMHEQSLERDIAQVSGTPVEPTASPSETRIFPVPGVQTTNINSKKPEIEKPGITAVKPPIEKTVLTELDTCISRIKATACYLADPGLGGRANGSDKAMIAAKYIASEFQKLGLLPPLNNTGFLEDYFQEFPVYSSHLVVEESFLELVLPNKSSSKVTVGKNCFFLPDSTGYDDITAPVVFAGYGITAPEYGYNDYERLDVRDKWVIVLDQEPGQSGKKSLFNGTKLTRYSRPMQKRQLAAKHGAVGLIIIIDTSKSPTVERYVPNQGKEILELSTNSTGTPSIPLFLLTKHAAAKLFRAHRKSLSKIKNKIDNDLKPVNFNLKNMLISSRLKFSQSTSIQVVNVLGLLPSKKTVYEKPYIIVGAHYDHVGRNKSGDICPGADDNASGVSVMLEAARIITENNQDFGRNILFASFGAEEIGCLGSSHYITHPFADLEETELMINLDMVGRNNFDLAENKNMFIAILSAQCPELATISSKINRDIGLEIKYDSYLKFHQRSDYAIFHQMNIPIFFYFTGFHKDYNSKFDRCEKLNYTKMAKLADHLARFIMELSNRAQPVYFNHEITEEKFKDNYKKPY